MPLGYSNKTGLPTRYWLGKKRPDLSRKLVGRKRTEESKRKISLALKGKPTWNKGIKQWKNKIHPMLGKHHSKESKRLMSLKRFGKYIGENHPMWKGGLAFRKREDKRNDSAYQEWTRLVKKRDKICQLKDENCGGYLVVHHIKSWRDCPELRYELTNGITLCQAHHPRKRAEEKRLESVFMALMSVSNV